MKISDNYKSWWNGLSDTDKLKHIKDTSIKLNNNHKKMLKASNAEFEYNGYRIGIRGGKRTTLAVNSQRATEAYLSLLDELKYFISTL